MRLVDTTKLLELQNKPSNVRNICIVAHVDHGKTTLADSLISSNGIISQRMSGKLRYMDSRPDEQERGITMKSSSISLYHVSEKEEYLVNLIDSPGHIDFSSEVSTAVRLCDGAIVVVDVVEGVCPQTRLALKQAYSENIKAVLVLNKIDRLILEMKMNALDAYIHISQVLEQVNAIMGELFASDVLKTEENMIDKKQQGDISMTAQLEDNNYYDWTSALEDADDSMLYFSPEQGNVVFASAIDGWGFKASISESYGPVLMDNLSKQKPWVDVVEGVCPQTRLALKQAYSENIKAVLVLNKIDRLILEMKMNALDAYIHISQVLEQVNAIMGELFASDVLKTEENMIDKKQQGDISMTAQLEDNNYYDWTSALEDADDSMLYFSPEQGNVVFASAIDGWGFSIHTFAKLFSNKLGVKEEILKKVLWGDFYLNPKTKRFMKGAQEKAKKPLFVQVIFDNLWNVYETIVLRNEKDKVPVICEKLNIKLTTRDLRHTDSRIQLQSLMMQWLPLSTVVLNMVCKMLPSPKEILPERIEKLMCSPIRDFDSYSLETKNLKDDFLACDSSEDRPVIIFVSKMFSVDKNVLPENKPKALTLEEMAARRERARQIRQEKQNATDLETVNENETKLENDGSAEKCVEDESEKESEDQPAFIAFARIFSGKVKKGSTIYVLGPKHDPNKVLNLIDLKIDANKKLKDLQSDEHITIAQIKSLYILMGRELEEIEEGVAGNIIGIGGLDEYVLKTATLSSTIACPAFCEIQYAAVPILRVAVEPAYPSQLPQLVKGLKLLNQSDPCVQVLLQESGEHVLVTAGEVHLQRCLEDLNWQTSKRPPEFVEITGINGHLPLQMPLIDGGGDAQNEDISPPYVSPPLLNPLPLPIISLNIYAKIPLSVSEPIVPFRETIIEPPKIDMANEEIDSQNINKGNEIISDPYITMYTSNKQSKIKIRAKPLPKEITALLEKSTDLLKAISQHIKSLQGVSKNDNLENELDKMQLNGTKNSLSERMVKLIEIFKSELQTICSKLGPEWENVVEQIWSVGPRNCGPNLLLNQTTDYKTKFLLHEKDIKEDPRFEYEGSFVNGFQLATLAGPLCEEPMMGVAFCVDEWTLEKNDQDDVNHTFGPLSGQIISAVKEACRKAFQAQPQRLMAAMYSCDIVVDQKVLGE
ncbi:Elongation factor Tu GTP-binding domain-containing protein 1 [Papilio machaon]|uniref:Elongation factor Tu GTP-binding domain-containing protein 1 n=1 Tax=Papilio machaon TaxID=76193 RepID=A0A0N1I5E4_PAPMA|nr:Elongation factor Tu GTP-binding domain-containing protein 1 [Papilio machaon]